jgi:hypothetical protein
MRSWSWIGLALALAGVLQLDSYAQETDAVCGSNFAWVRDPHKDLQ